MKLGNCYTIRYSIVICTQELTVCQFNLAHNQKTQKNNRKKLKTKTYMLRRKDNGRRDYAAVEFGWL